MLSADLLSFASKRTLREYAKDVTQTHCSGSAILRTLTLFSGVNQDLIMTASSTSSAMLWYLRDSLLGGPKIGIFSFFLVSQGFLN